MSETPTPRTYDAEFATPLCDHHYLLNYPNGGWKVATKAFSERLEKMRTVAQSRIAELEKERDYVAGRLNQQCISNELLQKDKERLEARISYLEKGDAIDTARQPKPETETIKNILSGKTYPLSNSIQPKPEKIGDGNNN